MHSPAMNKNITVIVARSQDDFDRLGYDFDHDGFCTLKEAKARAKYYLTKEYAQHAQEDLNAEPYGYAQVLVNGECVWDMSTR